MPEEFEITISSEEAPATGANVRVRHANGRCTGLFSLAAVHEHVVALRRALRAEQPSQKLLEQHGAALYRALFTGAVSEAWRNVLTLANERRRPVRLRLDIDLPALLAVPWEYLYDADRQQWLALNADISLVRGLPVHSRTPQPVDNLLKVIVMVADPSDLPRLDSARELASINDALTTAAVQLIPVAPTYDALQDALHQKPHVFHFIGHGTFTTADDGSLVGARQVKLVGAGGERGRNGEGYLALCRADDTADLIGADRLAPLLAGCATLGLVLLNACEGAVTGETSAFAGLAQRLLQQGIPAVIAMQAPIFDSHAVRFSRAFYTALANGYGIEAALGEGRKGIHGQAYSWGIPAFYLQGDEPFVLHELDVDERVNHLWQKAQQRNDLAGRRHLLAEILRLAPGHEAATAAQKALEQEARAEHLYAAARQYVQNEQWEDARRTLIQVDRIIHNYRDTLILLEEVIGKLPQELPPVPPAKLDHIDLILEALQRGRLTIFLGSDASSIGQPAARWEQGLYPPSAADAARALADEVALELTGERSMLQVSQYFELNRGVYDLYARLESLYNGDFEPTLLHHLLARLPTQLADKGLPNTTRWRYVIFTTAFDNLLEEAFAQAGQPYHLFAYRPPFVDEQDIPQPALFVHMPPAGDGEQGSPVEVRVPNQYRGHEDDNHPVIVKLCGWRVTADPDSVAVTEDQYVDYIAADRMMTVLPASLLRDLKPNSFLFFGHSLQPWHLRFLWKRLGLRVDERQPRKWAIVPALNDVEATFWQSQRIEPIVAQPEGVVAYVTNWLESL